MIIVPRHRIAHSASACCQLSTHRDITVFTQNSKHATSGHPPFDGLCECITGPYFYVSAVAAALPHDQWYVATTTDSEAAKMKWPLFFALQAKSLWILSPPLATVCRENCTLLTTKQWSFETLTTTLQDQVSG